MGTNRLRDLQVAAKQLAKSLRELSAGELSVNDLKTLTSMLKELTGVLRSLYEPAAPAEEEKRDGIEIRLEGLEELGK